jgi:enoyl-CoA hydratase/carnithine racemase
MSSTVTINVADGVASLDLNRPDRGNTVTRDMMRELMHHLQSAGRDPDVRVIAIRPRGADFCGGRDRQGESLKDMTAYAMRAEVFSVILDLYGAIHATPIPVVACVQGRAIGFGAALAGACDITLASQQARFAFNEIEHNSPPLLAMSAVMRAISFKALTYLIYSAEEIDAQEAVACGLASRILPAQEFDARIDAFLRKLAARPRLTLETVKRFQSKAASIEPHFASEYAGSLMALVRTAV